MKPLAHIAIFGDVGAAGYLTQDNWLPFRQPGPTIEPVETAGEAATPTGKVIVNDRPSRTSV